MVLSALLAVIKWSESRVAAPKGRCPVAFSIHVDNDIDDNIDNNNDSNNNNDNNMMLLLL